MNKNVKSNLTQKYIRILINIIIAFVIVIFIFEYSAKKLYPLHYEDYVISYAGQNAIDPWLVFAVIKTESGFNASATSRKGAKGLMQIMDDTAVWIAEKMNFDDFEPYMLYDPEVNIKIGCWYLRWLLNRYKGSVFLALTAYNSGIGNVNAWFADDNICLTSEDPAQIPFKETRNYVKKVMSNWKMYSIIYKNRTKYRTMGDKVDIYVFGVYLSIFYNTFF